MTGRVLAFPNVAVPDIRRQPTADIVGVRRRNCGSCRFYQRGARSGCGWCRNPERVESANDLLLVRASTLPCRSGWETDQWEAVG